MASNDLQGHAWCNGYADQADEWLSGLLEEAAGGDLRDLALVAVGGYGRRMLCPYSDLDVLLLHDARRDVGEIADRVWYPIWDEHIHLDHSVRTPREVVSAASSDQRVMLGLLDARLVAGDVSLADGLVERVQQRWRSDTRRWLPALAESVKERHEARGAVAFLLEPDLKESHGGLRDVEMIDALSRGLPFLTEGSMSEGVSEAREELLRIRVELHRGAGRALDRLLLQEQDRVAESLGYGDADDLMVSLASAAGKIVRASDDAWSRALSWMKGPTGRLFSRDRPLGSGLVLRDGQVALATGASPASDHSLGVRAADAAARLGVPVAYAALERIREESGSPPVPWPDSLRFSFLALLGAGRAAIQVIETLDEIGVWGLLLPEWEAVRHRPQRNAYHRYTVDRHLLETVVHASEMVRLVARPDLLLMGALLHDIGKGRPGDHSEKGAELAERCATRMGFSPDDIAVIVRVVRHHLLLPDTATRRDIYDPETVELVARATGDTLTLELLGTLAKADGIATGPAAWSQWKEGLVEELVKLALRRLAGEPAEQLPIELSKVESDLVGKRGVGVAIEGSLVSVVAPDRPGLLASVAGVLALHGLDVRSASAIPLPGGSFALERFDAAPSFGDPESGMVESDLMAVLEGSLSLAARLEERERRYTRPRMKAARTPEPRVIVDNEASRASTVVEVRASDRVALLFMLASTLFELGLDVRTAKVSTLGHEVVDSFYVVTGDGTKVTDPDMLEHLERALLSRLG